MPKRGKELKSSTRSAGGVRFSPPSRQSRNDYQLAGPSHSQNDSNSGRNHSNDIKKKSNGNIRHGNSSNRVHMNVNDSPIVLTDDDDDVIVDYKKIETSKNVFRENGKKLKADTGDSARLVKHFVPSATDRYHIPQSTPEKPMFRGPETDVLHELEKDKLKNIRVQMIRADVQQNDSFRKAYVIEEPVANRSKGIVGEKPHQGFEMHFNPTMIHYDNTDKNNYGMTRPMSPPRIISRNRSVSPRNNIGRPPSPPLPYSPERDRFNSDMLRRERSKRSPERNLHERPPRSEHFMEQHKMENFSSGPPEPRSPGTQRFRPIDSGRHRMKEMPVHYEDRSKRSSSPYFENHYAYRSPSPNLRPYSPNRQQIMTIPSPPTRDLSSPTLRDHPPFANDRRRRRLSPRRDRSRERRRRISPKKRTPPPPVRSPPVKRKNENGKMRGLNKNQEPRKREPRRRNRRSQSESKAIQEQQNSFQQSQVQPLYPPPPGVVRLPPPPRPFPPGPMLIPMRPPPFPPPMGGWRPSRPPMQAPPSGWPYPRPRPFYFPY